MNEIAKKFLSHLPMPIAARAYHLSRKVPFLHSMLVSYVRKSIPESVSVDEGILYLDRSDVAVSSTLALGMYEEFEMSIFRKLLRPRMNVVDAGAHIGYYSLAASQGIGQEGRVFAFEPEMNNRNLLEKNMKANNAVNVHIIDIALSDVKENRRFFIEKYNKAHHSFAKGDEMEKKIEISADTLDNLLVRFGSPKIDIIKMDIEGAEAIALEGMIGTIHRNDSMFIFTEFYPEAIKAVGQSPIDFLDRLHSLDFSLFLINGENKKVEKITDILSFMDTFPRKQSYKNILAVKGKKYMTDVHKL